MEQKKRKNRDRLQNLAILLLSLSAVYLFYLTQADPLGLQPLRIGTLFSADKAVESTLSSTVQLQELDWPVTVVASDAYGGRRFLNLSTGDSAFTPVETLLEDALGGGLERAKAPEQDARKAVNTGIFVDLPSAVPTSILAARLGVASDDETPVKHMIFSAEEETVALYLFDGASYDRCETALSAAALNATVEALSGASCSFALEQEDPALAEVDPLSVCPAALPEYPVLTAAAPSQSGSAELLTLFGFNAHTTNRYTESSGTEVIVESPRSLRIAPSGLVSYQGGADYASGLFDFSAAADAPLSESVGQAYLLIRQLLGESAGDAQLYLAGVEHDSVTTIRFGYMADGLPLVFGDGHAAAEVQIQDGMVTRLSLHYRAYTLTDGISLLLPLSQTAAMAADFPGLTLALSYVDTGRESVSASWLMR